MTTDSLLVRRIAVSAGALGAVCALGCWWVAGPMAALGSVCGTVLGTVNLWALAQLISRLIDSKTPAGTKGPMAVLYLAKALGFFVVAGFLVSRPWMHREGFMAGFTAVVVAIAVGGLSVGSESSSDE